MSLTCFPEAKVLAYQNGYYGQFRIFMEDSFRIVLEKGKKRLYPTSTDALNAAKDEIKRRLNPDIQATEKDVKSVADALGVDAWRAAKREMEQESFRSSKAIRTIRNKGKVTTIVERRNGRKAK